MATLNFHAEGGWYVTNPLTDSEGGFVAYTLKFNDQDKDACVVVETTINPSLGWTPVSNKCTGTSHTDAVCGASSGILMRLRTDRKPAQAEFIGNESN